MEPIKEYGASAVPVTVSALSLFGIPLNEWVVILTLFWLAIQIGGWVWKLYNNWRKKHGGG